MFRTLPNPDDRVSSAMQQMSPELGLIFQGWLELSNRDKESFMKIAQSCGDFTDEEKKVFRQIVTNVKTGPSTIPAGECPCCRRPF